MMADVLQMSDEEFLNGPQEETVATEQPNTEAVDEEIPAGQEGEVVDGENPPTDEPTTPAGDLDDTDDAATTGAEDEPANGDATGKPSGEEAKPGTEAKAPEVKDEAKKDEAKPDTAAIDYKAEYEKVMAPFKANGKEFKVKNAEDAQALMQMGANYSKKMAQLKPHLKLVKSLERAGLLTEEKISHMIDLMANKPGAINKLVKDVGIDPMDLDAEKAGEYQAGNHSVSDNEMDLEEVMNDLDQSPKIGELITFVTKELDHASREEIRKSPAILRVLDAHMNNGVYDTIMAELQNEITLGRLKNVPLLNAYQQIGDRLNKEGAFAKLGSGSSQPQPESKPNRIVEPPKSTTADADKLKEKRRAASSNRPVVAAPSTKSAKDFDVLNMTDADFLKMGV